MYEIGDDKQVQRLSKYVRCVQWKAPMIIECDKFFANFNLEICANGYVKAKEYYFVIHANFNELGYKPNIQSIMHLNPKFIAVSKWARDEFIKFTGKECDYCYNPLTLEPKEKVMHLVSACRLNDSVKGGARTQRLIKALDEYCARTGRHYIWHIFTNDVPPFVSNNVCLMKPRTDVRPYIADADIVLQLSNDMETYCYTTNEAWSYGVHTITTPLSVLKELPIPEGANYVLDWNCENINDVVRHIFEDELKPFIYKAPKDNWSNLLEKGKPTYKRKENMKLRVKVDGIKCDDKIVNKGDIVEVSYERGIKAIENNIAEEVEEEVKEATKPVKEVKKAVKKSTRK